MKKKTPKQLVQEATVALSDLNIFAAVQPDDFKIIDLCKRASQKCLRRYDRAMDALGMPYGRPATNQPQEKD